MFCTLLWCLFEAKASATTEDEFQCLFSENVSSELVLQKNTKIQEVENHVVAFKSPFNYNLNDDTRWEIINLETGLTFKSGEGTIKDMIFEIPGNYLIQISELITHNRYSCGHAHFPEKIFLEVSPLKMEFDFSTVKLSRNIVGNQDSRGITLTVDVLFTSYEGSVAAYTGGFTAAGVRTSLTGKLKNNEIILQQGMNSIEFQLEGQVSKDSYISIDFIDINGQIQSYRFINKII